MATQPFSEEVVWYYLWRWLTNNGSTDPATTPPSSR